MNKKMNRLEQYFDSSASRGWDTLVKLATETSWTYSESQKLLEQKLNNHTDIAKVLYALLGEESLDWVYRRVPALDGLSPIECLETPETIKRLKEALCRMDI
ncbi:DUF2384 domain-containing protein [Sphingobacterium sp. DR205]|uniref:DUF2384 domain-containing protein n=1 Tax=Sphingobacterium sp. DR205 TaxID=2713573 RepID=UPI0013E4DE67|nr:DUF2384 domain-containing protein [Sphingobacterium sp. DR205]QIH33856.1 DUF2384 domain-containing protein [Sphingobacterium sp. DR205]